MHEIYNPSHFDHLFFCFFSFAGVGVTYTFKNTRTMLAGLESLQESRETIAGGSGFFAIMRALELVPYDSAIFMSTDKIPHDINLVRYVATKLLKKRIRVCYAHRTCTLICTLLNRHAAHTTVNMFLIFSPSLSAVLFRTFVALFALVWRINVRNIR